MKGKNYIRIFGTTTIILILIIFTNTNNTGSVDNKLNHSSYNFPYKIIQNEYKEHDPIEIGSNEQLFEFAKNENLLGNGSKNDPIIIKNYNITGTGKDNYLLFIYYVTIHFRVENCYFSSAKTAILLKNLENGDFVNNIINNSKIAINMINVNNSYIVDNEITKSEDYDGCLYILESHSNLITNNLIHHNARGIFIRESNNNTFESNKLFDNYRGILVQGSKNTRIIGNKFYNHGAGGAIYIPPASDISYVGGTSYTYIQNNEIFDNQVGIRTEEADKLFIINNTMFNNWNAMMFFKMTETEVRNNTIFNNDLWSIDLRYCGGFNISWNNIIGNHNYVLEVEKFEGDRAIIKEKSFISQAREFQLKSFEGKQNDFVHNFWGKDEIKDNNKDGILDVPYLIDGNSSNSDLLPLAEDNYLKYSLLTKPRVLSPIGFEALEDDIFINWSKSIVYPDENVTYSIYYGDDNIDYDPKTVTSWQLIVSGLEITEYTWDTKDFIDGWYHIKVVAETLSGKMEMDTNDYAFTIGIDRARDQLKGGYGGSIPGMSGVVSIITMVTILIYSKFKKK